LPTRPENVQLPKRSQPWAGIHRGTTPGKATAPGEAGL
jgi:hypothetical protein